MADIIQIRRDTEANWDSVDPVLAEGEIGFEIDTYNIKVGDGVTEWTSLDYIQALSDNTSIHDNLANEISAITEKTAIVAADMFVIEDSADGNEKKMAQASAVGNYILLRPAITMTVKNVESSAMSKGETVYVYGVSSGTPTVKWTDAVSAATSSGMILIILDASINAAASGKALVFGYISGMETTAGTTYFLKAGNAGAFGDSAPSGTGEVVRVIGYGLSTTELFFNPDGTWIEIV